MALAFITPTPQVFETTASPGASSFISTSDFTCRCYVFFDKKNCRSIPRIYRSRAPIIMQTVGVKQHEITMPALSSTMTEGRIVQWLKQPGDKVRVGETVMIVESDKADMDVESFDAGYLASILVEEGESCPVGEPVGIIVPNKSDINKVKPPAASSSSPSPATSEESPPPPTPPVAQASSAPPATKPELAEVFMPALSSTMTEGTIVEWTKNEGDQVNTGDLIMVVQSDKADMDVESFDSGYLAHISVDAGDACAVGEPVAYISKREGDIEAVKAWAMSQGGATVTPVPEKPVSAAPESNSVASTPAPPIHDHAAVVNEGRIIASPLAKATAKKEGIDLKYVKGTGPQGRIVEADVLKAKASQAASATAAPTAKVASGKIVATPDAKKIAKKEKIDLSTIQGTGNFGRITAEDVLKAAGKAPTPASMTKQAAAPKLDEKAKPVETPAGTVAMNAMQQAVVKNMSASLNVPVFRITYKIRTRALDELYAKLKPKGMTMSALLAKAVAMSLAKHPIMNAAYAENSIVYRSEINVAMAVALEDGGLITPTLKNADKVDVYSLSRNWKDLVQRALAKKLTPDEYSSGTFVISNLGMFGVEQFDAVLPPGVPGILAIGASKPVVRLQDNGLVGVEKEMNVTLTADHRHIYGADGAKFLRDLASLIEQDITELLM